MSRRMPQRRVLQPTRRQILRFAPGGAAALLGVSAGASACASLLGEETIEAFIDVNHTNSGSFWGFTEYELDTAADEDQGAILKRVLLRAPSGVDNLRFITSLFGEAVTPDERTPLVEGGDFPENDTMAALDVLYNDDLRPFFPDGKKIRVEWSGTIDPNYQFPAEGHRVEALIVIEVL